MRIIIVTFIALLLIPVTLSWDKRTHIWICQEIYENNKEIQKKVNKNLFLLGCILPDYITIDMRTHRCYFADACKEINTSQIDPGGIPYFNDTASCFKGEYVYCHALEKFDEYATIFARDGGSIYLGMSMHYIADAICPVHQILWKDIKACHDPFEKGIDQKIKEKSTNWTIDQPCTFSFSCRKDGKLVWKCSDYYDANIKFSYGDLVKVVINIDERISSKLDITPGNYSNLLDSAN